MKPVKYCIVNGYPRSGKDTFTGYCQLHLSTKGWNGYTLSAVDFVKEVAKYCGWDGEKTPHNRKFLSDLKDLLTGWNDIPLKKIIEASDKIARADDADSAIKGTVIFIMLREPEEIEKFVKALNAMTIFVDRNCTEDISNHADECVENYVYDLYIDNNGDMDQLADGAKEFCDNLIFE